MQRLLTTTLIAALSLAVVDVSSAGKPGGGGGTPVGRIYYTWGSEFGSAGGPPYFDYRGEWSMNADGSDKRMTDLPRYATDLSHLVHQGHLWSLLFDFSLTSPGHGALFAVRDDGNPAFTVQLVDKLYWTVAYWAKDDSFISFGAETNDGGEIWVAAIAFDNDGVPALAAPPAVVVVEPQTGIINHHFSPQGDEVVYQLDADGPDPLLIRDLQSGATRVLIGNGESPAWSPDGASIAFRVLNVGIHVIQSDGTGLLQLTNESWGDYRGDWLPDSKHIVFSRLLRKNGPGGLSIYSRDVMRVSVPGGSTVNLTKDIDGSAGARFSRQ